MSVRLATVSNPPRSAKPLTLAGASVRWAVQSATAAGWLVDAADDFGDRETLAAARTWTPLRQHVPDANTVWVGGSGGRVDAAGLPLERLHAIAASQHFAVPATRRTPPGDEGWLIKSGGCGGMSVARWHPGSPPPPSACWQRRIRGRPAGSVWLADDHEIRWLGVCRSHHRRVADRPFVYAGSSGPMRLHPEMADRLRRFGHQIVAQTGWRGLFNVDFVVQGRRWWVLEANDRPTASCEVLERSWKAAGALSSNQSLIDWHLRAIGGQRCPQLAGSIDHPPPWLKRVLYATADQRFDPRSLRPPAGVELTDLPAAPIDVVAGDPLCTALWARRRPGPRQPIDRGRRGVAVA